MAFKILWVDDQIDELRSHVVYLGERGYEIDGAANGQDALEMLRQTPYDAILLDEMMPGMGGLETLAEIKKIREHVPVIMITKSEAEDLMTRAIGKRIDDYLVKPVSPLQVFSTLKRQLEARRLTGEQVTRDYLSHFSQIDARISAARQPGDWVDIYSDMIAWGLDLFTYSDRGLLTTQAEQMISANQSFARYVREHYEDWLQGEDPPLFSNQVFAEWVEPLIAENEQVFFILIDCMRLDQWRLMEPLLEEYFLLDQRYYWSLLPSATPYARNALFAGLTPLEIAERYPDYWFGLSSHEGSRNAHESELLGEQLTRLGSRARDSYKYFKVSDSRETDHLRRQIGSLGDIRLIASVYNFLDIVAHGRSQSQILKELAPDEAAFRSLMRSWFEHSSLFEVLKEVSRRNAKVVITTDHGSMFVRRATMVKGNRDTSSNVRYKFGDNLAVDQKQVFLMKEPQRFKLPANTAIENYAVTTEGYYLIYPTNYHEYERMYKESFQHGGISMEEMLCPFSILSPR